MKIITVLISVLFLSCAMFIPVNAAGKPSVSAQAAVLLCADSGEFVFESNANKALPMASTTKIMTAVVALDCHNQNVIITVGNEILSAEGTMLGLKVGDTIRLYDLVLAMMLSSGNDAANAIAVAVSGGIKEFSMLMNAYALDLGLENTNFVTPSGLDAQEHYTCARDLALLTRYALGIPEFVDICSSVSAKISLNDGAKTLHVYNHNKLLSKYDGAIGVKTGFTKKSGRCLVSAAKRNGVTLIAVTLNDGNDWQDHMCLLDYGFEVEQTCKAFGEAERYYVDVVGGESSVIECQLKPGNVICNVDRMTEVTVTVYLEHFIYAPIKPGECVGYAEYRLNGSVIGKDPICISSSTECLLYEDEVDAENGIISGFIKKIIGWFSDGRN